MANKKRKVEPSEIDMTPMIDCTFQLIIFFLCCEFRSLEGKLAANLPKTVGHNAAPAPPLEKLDLRIELVDWGRERVDPSNPRRKEIDGHAVRYYLGPQVAPDLPALDRLLREQARVKVNDKKGRQKPRPITIKTSAGVAYGDVTAVVDVALDAKFEEITFAGGQGTRKNPKAK